MPSDNVKWRSWKRYSGPSVAGTVEMQVPDEYDSHWERVLYVTALVESGGRFGAVTMYDGTGVTADLIQKILVYPRDLEAQGPLGKTLRRIVQARPSIECGLPAAGMGIATLPASAEVRPLRSLLGAFEAEGWMLSDDGVIRFRDNGVAVSGARLREALTPTGGAVPKSGPLWEASKRWATLFHELFAEPWTFSVQVEYGIEHFVKAAERIKHSKLGGKTIGDLCYNRRPHAPNPYMDEVVDLAMAMYWANSVNGPSPALNWLSKALKKAKPDTPAFAKTLIRMLGNSTYGRWDDDIPGGRYQRTRSAAMKVYPKRLFVGKDAVMPKDLPG